MDWTFDGQEPDFMTFDLGNGDMWNFDVADGPLDFEPTSLDALQASTMSDDELINPMQIDPALISPGLDSQDPLFAPMGSQKINERKRQPLTSAFVANLKTDLSTGSRLIHGQVTPPSSTSSGSPHTAPLDTVDPTALMPVAEDLIEVNPINLSAPSTNSATTTSKTQNTTSTSTSQAAPAAEGPPAKPKSKRGRKKKILAPAARDAQRARTLARNRAAAQRCRQRKKVEHAALEARARGLARDRAALHTLVGSLRDELLSLKGQMLRHASCADADSGVAAYVRQQREMLMRGMPEDESMNAGTASDDDDDFLRELGIDPKDPMGDGGDHEEETGEDDEEEEGNDNEGEGETPNTEQSNDNEDADGDNDDDDSVAQIDVPESDSSASRRQPPPLLKSETSNLAEMLLEANADNPKDTSDAGLAKQLRRRPRRTAKARARA